MPLQQLPQTGSSSCLRVLPLESYDAARHERVDVFACETEPLAVHLAIVFAEAATGRVASGRARALAAASLLLWFAAIVAGRLMAYIAL